MFEPAVIGKATGRKVKMYTRRQRHAALVLRLREERTAARRAVKAEMFRARRDSRKYEVFDGCDPARTEALAEGR